MNDWLSHTLSAAAGIIVTAFFGFLVKWKRVNVDERSDLLAKCLLRIDALERRVEELHAEHMKCERIQAELRGEIAQLRAANPKESPR